MAEELGDGEGEDDGFGVGGGVDFGVVGVEVLGTTIVPPELMVAEAEGDADGDAEGELESEGSVRLDAPVPLADG